jgi:hypothetical protein
MPLTSQRALAFIFVAAFTLALALFVLALVAVDASRRSDLWVELGKGLIQLIGIGLVGALTKLIADSYQERRTSAAQADAFRGDKLARVIDASNRIGKAWTLLEANRSAKSWSTAMVAIVDAGLDLRALRHQITAGRTAAVHPYPAWAARVITRHLDIMAAYTEWVARDFRARKQNLGELQRIAEEAPEGERQLLLDDIWHTIEALPSVDDYLRGRPEHAEAEARLLVPPPGWQRYVRSYERTLKLMTEGALTPGAAYEALRKHMAPGHGRTWRLDDMVADLREWARGEPHAPDDIMLMYYAGADGDRIAALAATQEYPNPELFHIVCDAIAHSRSAFEQYHALIAAQELSATLSDDVSRRRLRGFLEQQLRRNRHLRSGAERSELAKSIMSILPPTA